MSVYFLLTNSTVVAASGPPTSSVSPWGSDNPNTPPLQQQFVLEITGTSGNVSGACQVVGSNDGGEPAQAKNWVPVGQPMVAPSTSGTALAQMTGNTSFKHYGAYMTALGGTGASGTLKMST